MAYVDPDGRLPWGLLKKIGKLILKGGDAAATFGGIVEDAATVTNPYAPTMARAGAAVSLLSEVMSPVTTRDAKAGVDIVDGAIDALTTASKSGGAGPVRKGQAGEAAVRAMYDIGPKEKIRVNERDRIPDGINRETGTLSEVKNTKTLSYTTQLRDYVDYANAKNLRFDLYIRSDAVVSRPLLDARSPRFRMLEIPDP